MTLKVPSQLKRINPISHRGEGGPEAPPCRFFAINPKFKKHFMYILIDFQFLGIENLPDKFHGIWTNIVGGTVIMSPKTLFFL